MSNKRVVDAVNFLIEAPNYSALIQEMTKIIEKWDTHPMSYGGHLACLNALLDVGLHNRHAFERLVALIEEKRRSHPKMRRTDYQRDLMRDRRARLAKALALHEARFGPLRGAARIAEAKAIQDRWNAAKREFLTEKGELGWVERNEATAAFWKKIDTQLDANLKTTTRERLRA